MGGSYLERDGEQESLLRQLTATPVGRRWLLKAGLGSAAAVALANLPTGFVPGGVLAQTAPATSVAPSTGITLQFALGAALAGVGGAQAAAEPIGEPEREHDASSDVLAEQRSDR